jgi:hypothetical protein
MEPASHPSHTLWKSLRYSHITNGVDHCTYVFSCLLNSNHRHRKGLVTDVSGPQRNACPGTPSLKGGLVTASSACQRTEHIAFLFWGEELSSTNKHGKGRPKVAFLYRVRLEICGIVCSL